jgi:hypothetical protein
MQKFHNKDVGIEVNAKWTAYQPPTISVSVIPFTRSCIIDIDMGRTILETALEWYVPVWLLRSIHWSEET